MKSNAKLVKAPYLKWSIASFSVIYAIVLILLWRSKFHQDEHRYSFGHNRGVHEPITSQRAVVAAFIRSHCYWYDSVTIRGLSNKFNLRHNNIVKQWNLVHGTLLNQEEEKCDDLVGIPELDLQSLPVVVVGSVKYLDNRSTYQKRLLQNLHYITFKQVLENSIVSGNKASPQSSYNRILNCDNCSSIVLFESCDSIANRRSKSVNIWNIYAFYDSVVTCAKKLSAMIPNSVVVWMFPDLRGEQNSEVVYLHHYLSMLHLTEKLGILVLHPHSTKDDHGSMLLNKGEKAVAQAFELQTTSDLFSKQLRVIYASLTKDWNRSSDVGDVLHHASVPAITNENMAVPTSQHMLSVVGKHQKQIMSNEHKSTLYHAHTSSSSYLNKTLHIPIASPTSATAGYVSEGREHLPNSEKQPVVQFSLQAYCSRFLYTRKHDHLCHPSVEIRYPVLITGLGGSGTHYLADKLRNFGWRVRHEDIDFDGSVSWLYAVSDFMVGTPYPYGSLTPPHHSTFLSPRFDHVIQVVRHPLKQISSFTAHTNKTYEFVMDAVRAAISFQDPQIIRQFEKAHSQQRQCHRGGSCHLHFAALAWLYWNQFVRSYADMTFRVEEDDRVQSVLCQIYNKPHSLLSLRHSYCPVAKCVSDQNPLSPVPASIPSPSLLNAREDGSNALSNFEADAESALLDYEEDVVTASSASGVLGYLTSSYQSWVCGKSSSSLFGEKIRKDVQINKRPHGQYSLQDIAKIDSGLAQRIVAEARIYGYTL